MKDSKLKIFLSNIEYKGKETILENLGLEEISTQQFAEAFNLPLNSKIIFGFIIDPDNMYEIRKFSYRLQENHINAFNGMGHEISFGEEGRDFAYIKSTRVSSRVD